MQAFASNPRTRIAAHALLDYQTKNPACCLFTDCFILQIAYCLIYVLPLYTSVATRPSPTRSRDAPEAIRARIRAVSFSTAACSIATLLILSYYNVESFSPWHLMGYWPIDLVSSAKAVFLTALLFAGPLFECLVIDGEWQQWLRLQNLTYLWNDWPAWRNLVAVRLTAVPPSLGNSSSLTLCLSGSCHRGVSLPLRCSASTASCRLQLYTHHFPFTPRLWSRSRSPFL